MVDKRIGQSLYIVEVTVQQNSALYWEGHLVGQYGYLVRLTLILAVSPSVCFFVGSWEMGSWQKRLSIWVVYWNVLNDYQLIQTVQPDAPPCTTLPLLRCFSVCL